MEILVLLKNNGINVDDESKRMALAATVAGSNQIIISAEPEPIMWWLTLGGIITASQVE